MVQQLQNAAAELTHKLEEQEAENALLHKVHVRKQQGLAAQGPSELQQQEQTRLKTQHRELQTQLRKGHAQATELATQRSKLQRRHAKASDKRDRLHKALAATDGADPDGKGGGGGGGGAAEGGGVAGAEEDATLAKAERALKMAEQKRRGQQRRFQVQMRDSLSELKGLKGTLEAMTLQVAEDAPPPPRPRPAPAPPRPCLSLARPLLSHPTPPTPPTPPAAARAHAHASAPSRAPPRTPPRPRVHPRAPAPPHPRAPAPPRPAPPRPT